MSCCFCMLYSHVLWCYHSLVVDVQSSAQPISRAARTLIRKEKVSFVCYVDDHRFCLHSGHGQRNDRRLDWYGNGRDMSCCFCILYSHVLWCLCHSLVVDVQSSVQPMLRAAWTLRRKEKVCFRVLYRRSSFLSSQQSRAVQRPLAWLVLICLMLLCYVTHLS